MHPAAAAAADSPLCRVRTRLLQLQQRGGLEVPMLPTRAAQVLELAHSPQADAHALARLISTDQALAAQVMRLARSAALRSALPVNSLQHAIAWLGTSRVADIAFTAAIQSRLLNVPGQQARASEFWKRAVSAALWSREIATLARCQSAITYLCGLLHDIGKPIALLASYEMSVREQVPLDDEAYTALVHEFHAPYGVQLAERWNLPEAVTTCIALWHDYAAAPGFATEVRVVHLAHHLSELIDSGDYVAREALTGHPVLEILGLGGDGLDQLLERRGSVAAAAAAYGPGD